MANASRRKCARMFIAATLLLPVLFMYSTGVKTITVGDLFLLFSLILMLVFPQYQRGAGQSVNEFFGMLFFSYIFAFSFFYALFENKTAIVFTSARYLFYIFCSFFFFRVTDFEFAASLYKKIVVFATALIYVQTFFYRAFHIAIPGVLQFLPLLDETLYDYITALDYQNSGRCMSLFAEPSHFALYVLPMILLLLYKKKNIDKHPWFLLAFVSGGIIISAAFTGVIGLFACFLIYFIFNTVKLRVNKRIIAIIIAFLFLLPVFLNIPFIQSYVLNGEIFSRQSSGRFDGYGYIFGLKQSAFQILFGNGMDDLGKYVGVYLPGWARSFYYYGIIGTVISVCYFASFKRRNFLSLAILILLGIMMIGTEINVSTFVLPYLLLASSEDKTSIKGVSSE